MIGLSVALEDVSNPMSRLHARKKLHPDEDELSLSERMLAAPLSASRPEKPKRRADNRELKVAAVAVVSFILIALFLSGVVLHTQRRRTIAHVLKNPWVHGTAVLHGNRQGFQHHFYTGSPRFVTVVMPSVVNPSGRTSRLKAIQDTWGPSSRTIFVVHNETEFPGATHAIISEESEPEDSYAFPQLLLLPPHIGVDDGLPRLYHSIRTVFEKVNPDFAFFVNDHTYVIAEHLCKFLEEKDPMVDMYAGRALKSDESILNSGAAGYVLSRGTMEKIMAKWDAKDPECWMDPDSASQWVQGNPGLSTLKCLDHLKVFATDTRAKGKWHRFHAFPVTRVVTGNLDQWYINRHDVKAFPPSYKELLSGEDCCSMDSISFHYIEAKEARAMYKTRQFLLRNPRIPELDLKYRMASLWPADHKEAGFYSAALPEENDHQNWRALLKVMRKISMKENQCYC